MHFLTLASLALLAPLSIAAPRIPAAISHAIPAATQSLDDNSERVAKNLEPTKTPVPKVVQVDLGSFHPTLPRPIGSGAKKVNCSLVADADYRKKHCKREESETKVTPDGAYPGMASFSPHLRLPRAVDSGAEQHHEPPTAATEGSSDKEGGQEGEMEATPDDGSSRPGIGSFHPSLPRPIGSGAKRREPSSLIAEDGGRDRYFKRPSRPFVPHHQKSDPEAKMEGKPMTPLEKALVRVAKDRDTG
ncbi:MAG: hypothetical protein Q9191_001024 [Dirinaria sp. TL-2023a]